MDQAKPPMQPIVIDSEGTPRFRRNKIVNYLHEWTSLRGIDMNMLATMNFDKQDRSQFAQLIGYSVSGFGELPYADDEDIARADVIASELIKEHKSPRMTAVTDQVMAEVRDHREHLMKIAGHPGSIEGVSGKVATLMRACILIALNQLEE